MRSDIMSIKIQRLENTFIKKISEIIMTEVKDHNIKNITITSAKISSDLSYAKIYFATLQDDKVDEITKGLKKASPFIRTELAKRVDIRKMPELDFKYDESLDYGTKIENIIEKIKEDNNE